jgi:hypothetical protein
MAYEEGLRSITLDADSSVAVYTGVSGQPGTPSPNSGKQFHFVKVTGAHTAGLAIAATNEVVTGVLQNKPQRVGEACTVGIRGVSMVESGAAIAAGVECKTDASGRAVLAAAGSPSLGTVQAAATAAGQLIPVLLHI